MTSRSRFKVPSEKELGEADDPKLKPSSLFQSYKKGLAKNGSSTPQTTTTTSEDRRNPSLSVSATLSSSSSSSSSAAAAAAQASNKPVPGTNLSTGNACNTTETTPAAIKESAQPTSSAKTVSQNSIVVSFRQRGNPLLKHIRSVPWEYATIVPDYVMARTNCALFLSLRYHQLHPDYIHTRLKELGKGYDLRVLLAQVDVNEPHHLLKELTKICILADLTLILAFSAEEAGRYLEAYKIYENKSAEALMEKSNPDYLSQVTECLTTVKSVNRTDCMTLLTTFKSMEGLIEASREDIACCAGFGPQKARRLYDVFHEPFLKKNTRREDGNSVDGVNLT